MEFTKVVINVNKKYYQYEFLCHIPILLKDHPQFYFLLVLFQTHFMKNPTSNIDYDMLAYVCKSVI